jgi:protein TonB
VKTVLQKRQPNRLMQSMVAISLVVHLLIVLHISGLYRSKTITYIELSLQDISKPSTRAIPRPRVRSNVPKNHDVKKLSIQKQDIPQMKIDPVQNSMAANTLMEDIIAPDVPDSSGLNLSDWNPGGAGEFVTTNDYFGMVRLKIESCKKYPESAKSRHMEGRVKVQFVITTDGNVSSLKVMQHSGHASLSTAALNAVKKAAPFPKPPLDLFKGPLHIELTILFELT